MGAVLMAPWLATYAVYGKRKLRKAARRAGHDIGREQTARIMRQLGIRGASRAKERFTTHPDASALRAPDLVKRNFITDRPDVLWVCDVTHCSRWSGVIYVAFVTDVFSRRIVGWKASRSMTADHEDVGNLHASMPERLQIVVSLATWCQLRRGEILGLRRSDVDLANSSLRIEQSRVFLSDESSIVKSPKTRAGRRVIAIPRTVSDELEEHMARYVAKDPDALLVTNTRGVPVSSRMLQGAWNRARTAAGRPDLHLHDIRHTGLTLAAATGATTAELMHRAGHASPEAALKYQHATRGRDQLLADALDTLGSSDFNGGFAAAGHRCEVDEGASRLSCET